MNYPRIIHAVFHSPWAIHRPWFGTMFSLLHSRMFADGSGVAAPMALRSGSLNAEIAGLAADPLFIHGGLYAGRGRSGAGRFGAFRWGKSAASKNGRLVNHSLAIHKKALKNCGDSAEKYYSIVAEEEDALPAGQLLHIFGSGVLGKHLSSMDEMCSGGLSVDRIQAALAAARDDSKVSAIMLHLDSPGGISYGMAETAAQVRDLVAQGKVVGDFCDSLTASAAKWITCCSQQSYITPSADSGSIGCYAAHFDYTEWCKQEGIKVDLITDGSKFKGAGAYGTALTAEQRADIEASVKDCAAQFKADVRSGRAGIADDTMQGQCFTGQQAIDAKLCDTLVNDLETALNDLAAAV